MIKITTLCYNYEGELDVIEERFGEKAFKYLIWLLNYFKNEPGYRIDTNDNNIAIVRLKNEIFKEDNIIKIVMIEKEGR